MHPSLIALWPQSAIIMLVLLIVGPILLWLLYRWISRRLDLAQKKPKLSAIMAAFFVCLSLPILIFILAYNDYRHSEVMMATLKDDVDKTWKT
jgi:ABC-type amino acid transport system permease subunit